MAKPEWGAKRLCTSCGARFYDLGRQTIECPKCHTVLDPDQTTRIKRSRSVPQEEVKKVVPPVAVVEELDIEAEDIEDVDEDEDDVLEDASDLADDEDLEEFVEDPAKEKDAD